MVKKLEDYQHRIVELEASLQDLQQQLTESENFRKQTMQELQIMKAGMENTPVLSSDSEHFLRLAIDHLPQGVFWKDRNSVFVGCNQYLAQIAGLNSTSEIVGKTDYDLPWKPEEAEFFRECDRRVMESDIPELGIIEPQQQTDGSNCWLETNKIPLHDRQGNVIGILGTFADITDRINIENQLKQLNHELEAKVNQRTQELNTSQARLQRLIDNIPGLIYQFRLEADGTPSFPYVSEGSRDIYELNPEEFLQSFDLIHPSDRTLLDKAIEESARSLTKFHHEHRIITPSDCLKWVQVIANPERQNDGAILWDGLVIEISDRKQAEQEFLLFKRAVESSSDAIGITNLEGDLIYQNSAYAKAYGCETVEVFNQTGGIAACYSDSEEFDSVFNKIINQESIVGEFEQISRQGQNFLASIRVDSIQDENDQFIGFLGIITDITEQKRTESQLQEQEEFLRSVYDGVSNPIFVINVSEDRDFHYLGCNTACEENTGIKQADIIGKTPQEWMGEVIGADICDRLHECINLGSPLSLEECLIFGETKIWWQTTFTPLRDRHGRIYRIVGNTFNISDLKQAEQQIKQQEQLLRSIYDGVSHPIFVLDVLENGDCHYVSVNRATEQAIGKTKEQWFNKTPEEVFIPEQAQYFRENYQRCLTVGDSICYEENIQIETRQFWFLTTINPLKDENGRINRLVGTAFNISDRKIAEERLRESEERFRGLVETLNDWIWECDRNGILTYLGPQVVTMLGYGPEEMVGKTPFDFMPQEQSSQLNRVFTEKVAAKEAIEQLRNIMLHKEGYPVVLETSGVPILDIQGHVQGYRGVTRDISQRAKLEAERQHQAQTLRQKEALLQTTLAAGKMGCWSWNRLTNKLIWSDEIEEIYGLPAGSMSTDLEGYIELIHPDDRQDVLSAIKHSLDTEEEYNTEHRIMAPDGNIRWMRGMGGVWHNEKGEVIGLLGSIINDTQRKAAELALQESAEQIRQQAQQEQLLNQIANQIRRSLDLNHILETTVYEIQRFLKVDRTHFAWYIEDTDQPYWDVITEVQLEGLPSFIGQHPVANFGVLSEQLLSQKTVRLDDSSKVADLALQETLKALGNQSMLVLPISAESGQFGIIACIHHQTIRPWKDDEIDFLQAVVSQVAIALNQADLLTQSQVRAQELESLLDQLKQTQIQLIQSEKMSGLGQMVAGIAHEINNPVSFIHGNIVHAQAYSHDLIKLLRLYQEYYPQSHPEIEEEIEDIDLEFIRQDLHKLFQSMDVGTQRIREIVKSLRTFSRLDEADFKEVNLNEGIESTLTILQNRLRSQVDRPAIEVIKDYGELPAIACYAGEMNQVFMNIINNAIDALEERDRASEATPENLSTIQIQTRHIDNTIVIKIIDNGLGISPEIKARLFDPFFTTKPIGQGTGLGLSISYQIITEKHHGQLSCTSRPGQTTFAIEIPIQKILV